MIHDLTVRSDCINYQIIIYKHENEMNFQSKYFSILNQLVWRLLISGIIPMIKNKINNAIKYN
jgi:hypothetical protein